MNKILVSCIIAQQRKTLLVMDLLYSRLKGTTSEESKQYGMSFNPRENDCFVATFAKCGTTWVTFICHCLRSRGDLNFDDINQVGCIKWCIVFCVIYVRLLSWVGGALE